MALCAILYHVRNVFFIYVGNMEGTDEYKNIGAFIETKQERGTEIDIPITPNFRCRVITKSCTRCLHGCTMVHTDVYIVAYQGGPNGLGPKSAHTERSEECSERSDETRGCKLHTTQTKSPT